MLSPGKAATHMQLLAGVRDRLAGARADAWTAWCLRSAESVGLGAVVVDSDMHGIAADPIRYDVSVIGSGSWIALRVYVLGGVCVVRRCIVAAGAVVRRDAEDDTVVAGVPARAIRRIDYPDGCRKAWNNDWRPDHWPEAGYA